jgi:hypothetical protein
VPSRAGSGDAPPPKAKRARARPTTPDGCARFVELCEAGATEREAEAEANVNRNAVRQHPEWGPALAKAQAAYTSRQRRIVEACAGGEVEDPQQARVMFAAAKWILETRDFESYGTRTRSEVDQTVSGKEGAPPVVVRFPVNGLGPKSG